jgi:hypothetical protein
MWRPLRVTPEQVVCSRLCAESQPEFAEPFRETCNVPRINHLHGFLEPCFLAMPEVTTSLPLSPELKCKQGAKHRAIKKLLSHSKRRISTGRSLAAALAGTSVARSEIPIATREIHTPSIALGWKGT